MAIEIQETFSVNAPIDVVWNFMMDPENVAACMPGASLAERAGRLVSAPPGIGC